MLAEHVTLSVVWYELGMTKLLQHMMKVGPSLAEEKGSKQTAKVVEEMSIGAW